MTQTKACRTCKQELSLDNFSVSNGYHRHDCKKCFAEKQRKKYEARTPEENARYEVRRLIRKERFYQSIQADIKELKDRAIEGKTILSKQLITQFEQQQVMQVFTDLVNEIEILMPQIVASSEDIKKLQKEVDELEEEADELLEELIEERNK